jgi:hypothetical protein
LRCRTSKTDVPTVPIPQMPILTGCTDVPRAARETGRLCTSAERTPREERPEKERIGRRSVENPAMEDERSDGSPAPGTALNVTGGSRQRQRSAREVQPCRPG